jgi:predicted transcriptional regulator
MAFVGRRGRDRLYIIAEILEIAKDGTLKTQVMYRANLSFTQLTDYLKFMLRIRLLEKVETDGKDVYKATEKGLDFLQRYREIYKLLKLESDELAGEEEGMSIQVKERNRLRERETV